MTDIAQEVKKSEKKKAISKTSKTDETLLKDAKERIIGFFLSSGYREEYVAY